MNIFTISDYVTFNEAMDMGTILIGEAREWIENSVACSDLANDLRTRSLQNLENAYERLNWLQKNVYSKLTKLN